MIKSPFISSTDCVFISMKVWLWVKSTASIRSLLLLGIRYACTQFRNNGILLKFIKAFQELKKKSFPSFLAISCLFFFFFFAILSLTQPVKLEVGSCDCSTDFTQCNYCSDTRAERYKEKKEALQVISTKHWEKSNGESMRNFEAYQASSGTAGRKVLHFIISLSDFCWKLQ